MHRRKFLEYTAASAALSAFALKGAWASGETPAGGTLRYVPEEDLANFDPIWGTGFSTRSAALLVFDTLYGVDDKLVPHPQMIGSDSVSEDGLTWTFVLRPGLQFHDGKPVTSADVVTSLKRWKARASMGQKITAIEDRLEVVDDTSFRWVLKSKFPKMRYALGNTSAPCAFIMPDRIAQTDPFKQITEYVGSGPMRFLKDEWQVGVKAVFEKFENYVPRDEPASWMAGGKHVSFQRIEWHIIPDGATAISALANGEVDWVDQVLPDLIPVAQANPDLNLYKSDPNGRMYGLRLNHKQPPFSDVRVRRALMMAVEPADFLVAGTGDSTGERWKQSKSFFTPDTALYNENGADILKAPRDVEAAKKMIADAGFADYPVTILVPQEKPDFKGMGDVLADLLKQLGFKVEYVATDWGTIQARRQIKLTPAEGGWNEFPLGQSGTETANPAAYFGLQAGGDKAWFGWPDVPAVEEGIRAWYDAETPEQELEAAKAINAAAVDAVVYVPLGIGLLYRACGKTVQGVQSAPFPMFWGVSKS